jgi:hypothetical protein
MSPVHSHAASGKKVGLIPEAGFPATNGFPIIHNYARVDARLRAVRSGAVIHELGVCPRSTLNQP